MLRFIKVLFATAFLVASASATEAATGRTLHLLAVGVNGTTLRDKNMLNFADKDAADVVAIYRAQNGKLFANVEAVLVPGQDGTGERIVKELRGIATRAKRGDMVVVFLAGHGGPNREGEWVFESRDYGREGSTEVSVSVLRSTIGAMPMLGVQTVLFIDTCHAGYVDLQQQGVVVFASCLPEEASLELGGLRNGLFTSALKEGLEGKADLNRDGVVTLAELDAYLTERVDQLKRETNRRDPKFIDHPQQVTCGRPTSVPGNLPLVKIVAAPKPIKSPEVNVPPPGFGR